MRCRLDQVDLSTLAEWSVMIHPVTLLVVIADVFVPIMPSEFLVIASGSLASEGTVLLPVSLLTAAAGSLLGDIALYMLFQRRLTHWLDRFRWGRTVHLGIRNAVEKAGKSPTYAGLVALRFLPGGRTAGIAAAGIAELAFRPFVGFAALGGVLWACWLVGLGYVSDVTTGFPMWASALLGMGVGTLVGLIIAAFFALKQRREVRKTHEHADPVQPPAAPTTSRAAAEDPGNAPQSPSTERDGERP
ncbi:membrane protein DedA, SNARE-associated domain [Arthrobacter subterraneus]|uniref:Membrane protein DedA, SNARE-associated domain n=1 Tax=Arthrobacter subterraneus TaxID=335973 RepID=A0A1G8KJC6_9MICC|nr:membrane protein DedA, SNARE-associated domain [Arthrobacter subterraneus]